MTDETKPDVRKHDREALAEKLTALYAGLPEGERQVLDGLLQRLTPGEGDVQGFGQDYHRPSPVSAGAIGGPRVAGLGSGLLDPSQLRSVLLRAFSEYGYA